MQVAVAPGALQRILVNLVNNGLQHGNDVRVSIQGRDIHVIDSGPGIPEAAREEVFQPFFRLDRSRNVGTGGNQDCLKLSGLDAPAWKSPGNSFGA